MEIECKLERSAGDNYCFLSSFCEQSSCPLTGFQISEKERITTLDSVGAHSSSTQSQLWPGILLIVAKHTMWLFLSWNRKRIPCSAVKYILRRSQITDNIVLSNLGKWVERALSEAPPPTSHGVCSILPQVTTLKYPPVVSRRVFDLSLKIQLY